MELIKIMEQRLTAIELRNTSLLNIINRVPLILKFLCFSFENLVFSHRCKKKKKKVLVSIFKGMRQIE